MEFRQIKYFSCIAELQSLTKAASTLHIAQPALSVQMKNLEEELGVQLLLRHSRGVRLTDAGQVFLEGAKRILAEVEALNTLAGTCTTTTSDPVRLAINPSADPTIVGRILRASATQLPDIPLSISEGSSDQICEWLLGSSAHIGLVYFAPTDVRGIELEVLAREDLVLLGEAVGDAPATISFGEAIASPLILQPHPHKLRHQVEVAAEKLSTTPNIALEISSVTIILDLVEQGFGSTILPASAVKRATNGGHISARRITGADLGFDLSLAYVRDAKRTQSEIMVSRIVREAVIGKVHRDSN